MTKYPANVLKLLAAAAVALALPTAAMAVSQTAPKPVVGAGTINVPTLRIHKAPNTRSTVIAKMSEFRPQDYRPRAVLAIGKMLSKPVIVKRKPGSATKTAAAPRRIEWYKITVPGRPNGRSGWVRAKDVSIRPMPWQVVVYRGSRMFQLWKSDKLIRSGQVAIGAPGMETPLGLFYVTVRWKPVQETFLGAFAFELSGYSKLSDWPGGGVIGMHGWNDPSVFGRAVSHGCIRVSNENAAFLRDRIPVGTPVRVVPA